MINSSRNSSSSHAFLPEELDAICPILKIMNHIGLIGLSSVKVTRDDLGRLSYIITIYERFRSEKDNVADIGANI